MYYQKIQQKKNSNSYREEQYYQEWKGEFTRLNQIYGNHIIFLGTNGDPNWEIETQDF